MIRIIRDSRWVFYDDGDEYWEPETTKTYYLFGWIPVWQVTYSDPEWGHENKRV